MTRAIKTSVVVAVLAALGLTGYLLSRPEPGKAPSAATEENATVKAPSGVTVLTSSQTQTPRVGRFGGEWEQVSGSAKVTCGGKLAKEQGLSGKRFKVVEDQGKLLLSDEVCDILLKVQGDTAMADVDTCVPKRGSVQAFKIVKQSLQSADGELATIQFEGTFHATPTRVENGMDCTIVAESTARRL